MHIKFGRKLAATCTNIPVDNSMPVKTTSLGDPLMQLPVLSCKIFYSKSCTSSAEINRSPDSSAVPPSSADRSSTVPRTVPAEPISSSAESLVEAETYAIDYASADLEFDMSADEIESDVEETSSQLSLSSLGAIMHAHEQPSYNDVLQPSNSNVAVRFRPPSTTQTGSIQNSDSSSDEQSSHVSQLPQPSSSSYAAVRPRQLRTAHVAGPIQYFDSSSESETDVAYYYRQEHTEAVKKRVRRKVRSEKYWARNIRKHRRNKGLSYTSIGGKEGFFCTKNGAWMSNEMSL